LWEEQRNALTALLAALRRRPDALLTTKQTYLAELAAALRQVGKVWIKAIDCQLWQAEAFRQQWLHDWRYSVGYPGQTAAVFMDLAFSLGSSDEGLWPRYVAGAIPKQVDDFDQMREKIELFASDLLKSTRPDDVSDAEPPPWNEDDLKDLGTTDRRVVRFLWNHRPQVEEESVINDGWGGNPGPNALKSSLKRINKWLVTFGLTISRNAGFVEIC
jgi:hypothetical protein